MNKENVRATITYKSGRKEVMTGKLRTDQRPYKRFEEKLGQLRDFPTVEKIVLETF